jgi:hypothetical protein
MNRREFLKISSLTFLVSLAPSLGAASLLFAPVEAEFQGRRYRGTYNGKILVSNNAGRTWQLHTNLGSHCAVVGLQHEADGQLYSQMRFDGYPFRLALTQDGKSWKTAG